MVFLAKLTLISYIKGQSYEMFSFGTENSICLLFELGYSHQLIVS
jgi:hypothetical protein